MVPQRWSLSVADKEIAVKKYVVKLADDEREQLNTLIRSGKHAARKLLKARILLKADVSDAGEGWSDSQIAAALDTSVDTVARTRQRLVEEGYEVALVYKYSPASARPRIFDGGRRSETNRSGLQQAACGAGAVDLAASGRKGCGIEHRRARQRQYTLFKPEPENPWAR
jgi:hypothetical protein